MKRLLLMGVALLMAANVARADHFTDHISVYSDASGSSCHLFPGYSQQATVIHKFTIGAIGSRFRLELPAGSTFLSFLPVFPPYLPVPSAGFFDYGGCLQGSFVVGTIVAILEPGELWVRPEDGYSNVMVIDCSSTEHTATCGGAVVGGIVPPSCPSCQTVATEQTTWGAVKSLYRD